MVLHTTANALTTVPHRTVMVITVADMLNASTRWTVLALTSGSMLTNAPCRIVVVLHTTAANVFTIAPQAHRTMVVMHTTPKVLTAAPCRTMVVVHTAAEHDLVFDVSLWECSTFLDKMALKMTTASHASQTRTCT